MSLKKHPKLNFWMLFLLERDIKMHKKISLRYKNAVISLKKTPSEGIEPPSQEPESYVCPVAPRGLNNCDFYIIC